jgi:AraC family transcriptional regulator
MAEQINDLKLITKFPEYKVFGVNEENYNRQFKENNVIIKADSANISFPEHWGPLSIKWCSGGKENYVVGSRFYSVQDSNFLVLNEGQYYSSYIYSDRKVASFTINFNRTIQNEVADSFFNSDAKNLDKLRANEKRELLFTEKLYGKSDLIMPLMNKLKKLSDDFTREYSRIEELLYRLLEKLVLMEQKLTAEVNKVDVLKPSTKSELYRRLHFVKDYLDSCYQNEIKLNDMARVANLNSAYLLRKFKNFFSITPRQYLIKKRMEIAAELLKTTDHSITEICGETGYADLTSFGKLFKQFYHISPEKYRMKEKNLILSLHRC